MGRVAESPHGVPGRLPACHTALPVGEAAIFASQVSELLHLERARSSGLAVELDPQPRAGGGQQVAIFPHRLVGNDVGQGRARLGRLLLHGKVGDGQVELQTGGGSDGAERVVDGHAHLASSTRPTPGLSPPRRWQ